MALGIRRRLVPPLRAFADVFKNPNLRRLMLAWNAFFIGDWAYMVAIAIYAYRVGGPLAVGIVEIAQTFPAAIAAPFAALLSDRYPRHRVYLVANMLRALALLLLAAAVLAQVPTLVVYPLAAVNAMIATTFWPAQTALLPELARSPEELTAANAASSTIEGLGGMIGSALGGIIAAVAGVGIVFVMAAAVFLLAAFFASRIRMAPTTGREARAERSPGAFHELLEGFRAIRGEAGVPLLVLLVSAEWLLRGALTVLIVATALFLLHLWQSGVGFLNSSFGVWSLVWALGSLAL
ncbi:MAG: MFS transporter, partial [Actinomycetota bacterium]|nr:MFS transporter [Actinomycetota bacterium]